MLDDYKETYKKCADKIPNWQHISKNDLCNLYIKNEDDKIISEAYFSAIIYRYWNLIPKYYGLSYNVATPEDVYEWLLSSIMYALKHRSWLRSGSSIYGDEKGPDKVINRCMKCRRLTYYQAINRKKRKQGFNNISLDRLTDEQNDGVEHYTDEDDLISASTDEENFMLNEYIKKLFFSPEPIHAFLIDIIAYRDTFHTVKIDGVKKPTFQVNKVVNYFCPEMVDKYSEYFSNMYDINYESVKSKFSECVSRFVKLDGSVKRSKVVDIITIEISNLSQFSYFKELASSGMVPIPVYRGKKGEKTGGLFDD